MIFIRAWLVASILLVFKSAAAGDGVDLLARHDACKNSTAIRFELLNKTNAPISTISGGLPWFDGVFGARLYGFHNQRDPQAIRQMYGVQSSVDEIEIPVGSSVIGEIELLERFPDLGKLIGKGDIYIFWFYEFFDVKNKKSDKFNGMVLIPEDLKSRCRKS